MYVDRAPCDMTLTLYLPLLYSVAKKLEFKSRKKRIFAKSRQMSHVLVNTISDTYLHYQYTNGITLTISNFFPLLFFELDYKMHLVFVAPHRFCANLRNEELGFYEATIQPLKANAEIQSCNRANQSCNEVNLNFWPLSHISFYFQHIA